MFRVFIGIRVATTPGFRALLDALGSMRPAVRPLDAASLHLTLRFLGDTGESRVPAIAAVLRTAMSGVAASEADLIGVGAFPGPRRPSVVWVGLAATPGFRDGVASLEHGLVNIGVPPANRPWTPHLTVARVKAPPPSALRRLLDEASNRPFGAAWLGRVDVLRSELRPDGARYHVLESVTLPS